MAGRKNKTTVDYFPHYCDNGSKTMFILENKFGLTGYAVWYKTLEMLGRSSNHYIDLRNDTDKLFLISKLGITEQVFNDIYDLLAKLNAIDLDLWKHQVVYSDNFISNIEDVYVRRNGIDVLRKYDLCKHLSIKCKQKVTNKSKGKESKLEERKLHFRESLIPYVERYNKSLIRDFFDYWSEHGITDVKMRFEKERTFGLTRRLSSWEKRSSEFNGSKSKFTNQPTKGGLDI